MIDNDSSFIMLLNDPDSLAQYLYKVDLNGKLLWKKYLGDKLLFSNIIRDWHGYVMAGMSFSYDTSSDPYLLQLDSCFETKDYLMYRLTGDNRLEIIKHLSTGNFLLCFKYLKRDYYTFAHCKATGEIIKNVTFDTHFGTTAYENGRILFWGDTYRPLVADTNTESLKPILIKCDSLLNYAKENLIGKGQDSFLGSADGVLMVNSSSTLIATYTKRKPFSQVNILTSIMKMKADGKIIDEKIISNTTKYEGAQQLIKLDENKYTAVYAANNKTNFNSFLKFCTFDSNLNVLKYAVDTFLCQLVEVKKCIRFDTNTIFIVGTLYFKNGNRKAYIRKYDNNFRKLNQSNIIKTYDQSCTKQMKMLDTIYLGTPRQIKLVADSFQLKVNIHQINQTLSTLKLYPNPAENSVNLISTLPLQTISINDETGKLVKTIGAKNAKFLTIDITDLANGIYFITAIYNKGNQQSHFIINR